MHAQLRTIVLATVTGFLVFTVLCLDLNCSAVNFWAISQQQEELRQLERASFDRTETRRQLAKEWIDRRCTLAELFTQYQELDRDWPDYVTGAAENGPQKSRTYQQVLGHVEFVLRGRPEELAAVKSRLEREFQELRAGGD